MCCHWPSTDIHRYPQISAQIRKFAEFRKSAEFGYPQNFTNLQSSAIRRSAEFLCPQIRRIPLSAEFCKSAEFRHAEFRISAKFHYPQKSANPQYSAIRRNTLFVGVELALYKQGAHCGRDSQCDSHSLRGGNAAGCLIGL